eukprot:3119498-Rhodomonas_salina.1
MGCIASVCGACPAVCESFSALKWCIAAMCERACEMEGCFGCYLARRYCLLEAELPWVGALSSFCWARLPMKQRFLLLMKHVLLFMGRVLPIAEPFLLFMEAFLPFIEAILTWGKKWSAIQISFEEFVDLYISATSEITLIQYALQ